MTPDAAETTIRPRLRPVRHVLFVFALTTTALVPVPTGTAAAEAFSCPNLAGATLFAGGDVESSGSGFHVSCVYSKDNADAGDAEATWDEPPVSPHCPFDVAVRNPEDGRIVSDTRAAAVSYRFHAQPPGDVPEEAMLAVARQLLAFAETRAVSCDAGPTATPSSAASPTATPSPSAGRCPAIEGVVTDGEGLPIRGAHVRLESGGTIVDEEGTGTDGRYHLAVPEEGAEMRVVLLAEEFAHSPSRFRLVFGSTVVGATTPAFDPADGGCTRDFAMDALDPGITAIPSAAFDIAATFDAYQALDASWTLASRLQPEPSRGLPLQVFLSCERSGPPPGIRCPVGFPAWFTNTADGRPYIAMDANTSSQRGGAMGGTIGHEFGHFFMWSSFGGLPSVTGTYHAGYYANPSSSESWVEGFASFYGLMVLRQVSGDPDVTSLPGAGDLDTDIQAWLNAGKEEELAVAGILLDLVDAPNEPPPLVGSRLVAAESVRVSEDRELFAAEVPPGTETGTTWRADLLDSSGRRLGTTRGAVVEWEGRQLALGKLPRVPFATLRVSLRPYGMSKDDDPIAGDLFALWPAILNFRSGNPGSVPAGNHLFDVHELYLVAQGLYGATTDGNGNGVPDVDEIFVAHGFFADTAGGTSNRNWERTEAAGFSSHTQTTVGSTTFPGVDPRTSPPLLPELSARIDTGGVPATALVQVGFSGARGDTSFASLVEPDETGAFPLPIPPPGSGGTVSVIMLAPGYRPAPALEVDPEAFWPEAERNTGHTFLSATVPMERGDVVPSGGTVAVSGRSPSLILAAILIVAAVAGIGAYWYVRRARRPGMPPGR